MERAAAAYLRLLKRDNPAGVYALQDVGSTAAGKIHDLSGNNRDGTVILVAGAGWRSAGAGPFAPWAYTNNGGASYIDCGTAGFDFGDVFTMECWFQRSAGGSGGPALISKGHSGGGQSGYLLRFDEANSQFHILCSHVADMTHTSSSFAAVAWHHVMATKNGSTMHIYVDGKDDTVVVTNTTCTNTTLPLLLGTDWSTPNEDPLKGSMAWAAVYPTALPQNAAVARYYAGRSLIGGVTTRSRLRAA